MFWSVSLDKSGAMWGPGEVRRKGERVWWCMRGSLYGFGVLSWILVLGSWGGGIWFIWCIWLVWTVWNRSFSLVAVTRQHICNAPWLMRCLTQPWYGRLNLTCIGNVWKSFWRSSLDLWGCRNIMVGVMWTGVGKKWKMKNKTDKGKSLLWLVPLGPCLSTIRLEMVYWFAFFQRRNERCTDALSELCFVVYETGEMEGSPGGDNGECEAEET